MRNIYGIHQLENKNQSISRKTIIEDKHRSNRQNKYFKNLGWILTPNMNEKVKIQDTARKTERAFRLNLCRFVTIVDR